MSTSKDPMYFASFAAFTPTPNARIEKEFKRLAKQQGWRIGSKKYKEERGKCLLSEFEVHVGYMVADDRLNSWWSLCIEVGISQPPKTVKECKRVLSNVFVNLVDLIDSQRRGTKVSTFRNLDALRTYTIKTHKTFPKQEAKQDVVLKVLLREIYF